MENTTYILQKDLPGIKAGEKIVWHDGSKCYSSENLCYHGQYPMLSQSVIDKYPDFFKKETEHPSEQFVWTDELVEEYKNTFYHWEKGQSDLPYIEQFKQSKVKKEEPKQWEILEFEHSSGRATFELLDNSKYRCDNFPGESFTIDDLLNNKNGKTYIIKKVKRLSDGEVFTVGDTVKTDFGSVAPIVSFKIAYNNEKNKGNPDIYVSGSNLDFGVYLDSISKSSPKESPLPIKVEMTHLLYREKHTDGEVYEIKFNKLLGKGDGERVKKAIESVLNSENIFDGKKLNRYVADEYGQMPTEPLRFSKPKKYTSDELLEAQQKAFWAGRNFKHINPQDYIYPTFNDYIQSLNK